jgi:membrane protease YdiL (CAAX protease family)
MHTKLRNLHISYNEIKTAPRYSNRLIAVILSYATIAIVAVSYLKNYAAFLELTYLIDDLQNLNRGTNIAKLRQYHYFELLIYIWWWWWQGVFYFVIPIFIVKWKYKYSLKQFGLRSSAFPKLNRYYILWFLVTLLAIVIVSSHKDFVQYYPFYKKAHRSLIDFVAWQAIYLSQFLFLEFFFRGLLLNVLYRKTGILAVFIVVIPYVMIHITKPWLEALASFPFGLFLGYMALKTRSILSGFYLHVAIALSLDVSILLKTSHL